MIYLQIIQKNSGEAKDYTRMSHVLVHFHMHQVITEQKSQEGLRNPKAQILRTSWCPLEEIYWFHDSDSICYFSFPNVYNYEHFSYTFFTQGSMKVRVLHLSNAQMGIFVIIACERLCVCELQGSLS